MDELKPCPFCGSVARLLVIKDKGVCVCCTKCEAQTPWNNDALDYLNSNWESGASSSVEDVMRIWNRRANHE